MCNTSSHCLTCYKIKNITHILNMTFVMQDYGKVHAFENSSSAVRTARCVSLNAIRLLCYLASEESMIKSRSEIEKFIWNDRHIGLNSLPVLLHELRKILGHSEYRIITVRGTGYMITRKNTVIPQTLNTSETEPITMKQYKNSNLST